MKPFLRLRCADGRRPATRRYLNIGDNEPGFGPDTARHTGGRERNKERKRDADIESIDRQIYAGMVATNQCDRDGQRWRESERL